MCACVCVCFCHISHVKCDKTNGLDESVVVVCTIGTTLCVRACVCVILEILSHRLLRTKSALTYTHALEFKRYDWDGIATTAVMITTTFQNQYIPVYNNVDCRKHHPRKLICVCMHVEYMSNLFWLASTYTVHTYHTRFTAVHFLRFFFHHFIYLIWQNIFKRSLFIFIFFLCPFPVHMWAFRFQNPPPPPAFNSFCSTQFHFPFCFYPNMVSFFLLLLPSSLISFHFISFSFHIKLTFHCNTASIFVVCYFIW